MATIAIRMLPLITTPGPNRFGPRISVETLCTELDDQRERHATVIDLSQNGLRLQRPLDDWMPQQVQLEFEIPEVDEVVWASGELRFDEAWLVKPEAPAGMSRIVRTSGIQIVSAAERHKRMLREYVMDNWLASLEVGPDSFMGAACYRLG